MVAETARRCDSCKAAAATVFCKADTAYLCLPCDSKVHAANKVASRHARVWVCEVCEHAPASVTCKADAAALCGTCDSDIHEANPLARRHERVPVVPFYDTCGGGGGGGEEVEAESWLLTAPSEAVFGEDKGVCYEDDYNRCKEDGVVPVQSKNEEVVGGVVDGYPYPYHGASYEMDVSGSKHGCFIYNFASQSISQSVSSSSLEVGVVPDHNNTMADVSNRKSEVQLGNGDREARVLRYREKRKNRKFEKTIRYASRKAYAETRPRIKGRFAKRTTTDPDPDLDTSYGVVPSF